MTDGGFLTPENIAAARGGKTVNKYRVAIKERRTYNGVVYASRLEAARARILDELVRHDEIRFWIGQPKFRLGCPENVYVADFLVVGWGARVWVEDVKGVQTAKFKRDKRLWKEYGPCTLSILRKGEPELVEPERSSDG